MKTLLCLLVLISGCATASVQHVGAVSVVQDTNPRESVAVQQIRGIMDTPVVGTYTVRNAGSDTYRSHVKCVDGDEYDIEVAPYMIERVVINSRVEKSAEVCTEIPQAVWRSR